MLHRLWSSDTMNSRRVKALNAAEENPLQYSKMKVWFESSERVLQVKPGLAHTLKRTQRQAIERTARVLCPLGHAVHVA